MVIVCRNKLLPMSVRQLITISRASANQSANKGHKNPGLPKCDCPNLDYFLCKYMIMGLVCMRLKGGVKQPGLCFGLITNQSYIMSQ